MSDILIKGMEMPKGNDYLHLIIQNGKVHTALSCGHLTTDKLNVADAIEVKPHGDLIDRDLWLSTHWVSQQVIDAIKDSPTVLEATE